MPKIRITCTPPGQAPEAVRELWVGLVMETLGPVDPDAELRGAVDGKVDPNAPNAGGYRVTSDAALDALEAGAPEAAEWWKNMRILRRGSPVELVFSRDVCEYIP